MKKSFLERSYYSFFIIFLVLLNSVFIFISAYIYKSNVDTACRNFSSDVYTISQNLNNSLNSANVNDLMALQYAYGNIYKEKNFLLQFKKSHQITFTTIPDGVYKASIGIINEVKHDGKLYLLNTSIICNGDYELTIAKDSTYLLKNHARFSFIISLASFFVSALFSGVLLFTLKKLHSPLNNLRAVAESYSQGDYSKKADESGDFEFSTLAETLNIMGERINEQITALKKSSLDKQEMLDDLAHEMRTPLTVIQGYTEYLLTAKITETEREEALNSIGKEAVRLKKISESLLNMTHLRKNCISPLVIDLSKIISETAERYIFKSRDKNITVNVKSKDTFIKGDETLIELLVSNLLDNALNACEEHGNVDIGTLTDKEGVKLYVRDNGKGMAQNDIENITAPFYRVNKSRSRAEGGTGLGLTLCKTIADAHGAKLSFESVLQKGTTVHVFFKI